MPIYSFVEYSSNYSHTTCSLWIYCKDEATNFDANIPKDDACEAFACNAKLLENLLIQLINFLNMRQPLYH